jgi:hypothetical protein
MAGNVVRVEPLLERLFADDDTKDVTITMSDGNLKAHSCILVAASEAIRGMLRHGVAAEKKKLSWKEHSCEVGSFVLRLIYTGITVEDASSTAEEDANIKIKKEDASDDGVVPLSTLLGGLQLATIFQLLDLIAPLCHAAEQRLSLSTFDSICSAAIKMDLTLLRLNCLQFAKEFIANGARVKAEQHFFFQAAKVPPGTLGTCEVCKRGNVEVKWDNGWVNSLKEVRSLIKVVESSTQSEQGLRALFDRQELSPEVMFELTPLWGNTRRLPKSKRPRLA